MVSLADIEALQPPGRDINPSSCDGGSNCQRWLNRRLAWLWSQEQNQIFASEVPKRCVEGQLSGVSIRQMVTDADLCIAQRMGAAMSMMETRAVRTCIVMRYRASWEFASSRAIEERG